MKNTNTQKSKSWNALLSTKDLNEVRPEIEEKVSSINGQLQSLKSNLNRAKEAAQRSESSSKRLKQNIPVLADTLYVQEQLKSSDGRQHAVNIATLVNKDAYLLMRGLLGPISLLISQSFKSGNIRNEQVMKELDENGQRTKITKRDENGKEIRIPSILDQVSGFYDLLVENPKIKSLLTDLNDLVQEEILPQLENKRYTRISRIVGQDRPKASKDED